MKTGPVISQSLLRRWRWLDGYRAAQSLVWIQLTLPRLMPYPSVRGILYCSCACLYLPAPSAACWLPLRVHRPVSVPWVPPVVASCHYFSPAPSCWELINSMPYFSITSPGLRTCDSSAYTRHLHCFCFKFAPGPVPSLSLILCSSVGI